MKRCGIVLMVLLLVVALPTTALTNTTTMQCRGKRIKLGDSKAKILTACGKPLQRRYVTEKTNPWWKIWSRQADDGSTMVEKWVYDKESCGIQTLTFRGVTLIKIEEGDKL